MPTKSSFEDVEIPNVDLWGLMFEQKRDFEDSKGEPT
jgi:4-coumarate--CoA ligase